MWVRHLRRSLGDKGAYWDGPFELERAIGKGLYSVKVPHPSQVYGKEGYKLIEVVSDDMKPYPRLNPTHTHTLNYSRDVTAQREQHATIPDYEVEEVQAHRSKWHGKLEFLTKWK